MIATLLVLAVSSALAPATGATQKAWSVLEDGVRSKNVDTRTSAVHALRLVRENQQAQEMAEKALSDDKWEVRAAAAEALGRMDAVSSVSRLRAALSDEEPNVALAAASSLVLLGDLTAYEVYGGLLTEDREGRLSSTDSLAESLKTPKGIARLCLEEGIGFVPVVGLGYKVFKRVFSAVKGMSTRDRGSSIRAAAALRLAEDPDPRSGTALARSRADKSWRVRVAVVDAIAERDDPALLDAVIPLLDDEHDAVRYDAAAAVVRLSDRASSDHSWPDPQTRRP